MPKIQDPPRRINPQNIRAFVDKIGVWFREPLNKQQLTRFNAQDFTPKNRPSPFGPACKQLLQFYQPSAAVLAELSRRDDARFNYAEFSLDWIFSNEDDTVAAFWFLDRHIVKNHHGRQIVKIIKATTRYSGPRRAPNVLAAYHDKHCKITGEVDCLHLDWRIRGRDALRRVGFTSIADLVGMDHRQFWQQRLLLYEFDPRELGRRYYNWVKGTRRRGPWVKQYGSLLYDSDQQAGRVILFHLGTVQAVLDQYRNRFDVRSCLIPMPVTQLLPRDVSFI